MDGFRIFDTGAVTYRDGEFPIGLFGVLVLMFDLGRQGADLIKFQNEASFEKISLLKNLILNVHDANQSFKSSLWRAAKNKRKITCWMLGLSIFLGMGLPFFT